MTGVALLFVLGFGAVLGAVVLAMRVVATPRRGRIRQKAGPALAPGKYRAVLGYTLGFVVGSACWWLLFILLALETGKAVFLSMLSSGAVAVGIGLIVSYTPRSMRATPLRTLVRFGLQTAICVLGFCLEYGSSSWPRSTASATESLGLMTYAALSIGPVESRLVSRGAA